MIIKSLASAFPLPYKSDKHGYGLGLLIKSVNGGKMNIEQRFKNFIEINTRTEKLKIKV